MKRIVILISGRGSNMQAIVQASTREHWDARVVAVISNRSDADGLAFAQANNIATEVVDNHQFAERELFDDALSHVVNAHAPDLLLLAGFMRILTARFVRHYEGRMLNIHPSLLPAFAGLHTHRRAIAAGCKIAGATVHFVTPEVDHGPIIAQTVVPILPDDTEHALAARVLAREHVLYPLAVGWWLQDLLRVEQGVVVHLQSKSQLLM